MKTRENIPPTIWSAWCQAQVRPIAPLDWLIHLAAAIYLGRWESWKLVISQVSHLYPQTTHVRTDSSLCSDFVSVLWLYPSFHGRSNLSRKVCRVLVQILVSWDPSRPQMRLCLDSSALGSHGSCAGTGLENAVERMFPPSWLAFGKSVLYWYSICIGMLTAILLIF